MRIAAPSRRRVRTRRLAGLAVLVAVGLAGAYLGLRDTSLFAVRSVVVRQPGGLDAPRLQAALVVAARRMSTLHVRHDELRRAVAGFPQVKGLEVDVHPPHGLTITVREHVPVALLVAGSRSLPVAGDRTLLPGVAVPSGLPTIAVDALPAGRIARGRTGDLVRVLAAAPPPLGGRVAAIVVDSRGVVARLRAGPDLVFGTTDRLAAKWAAGARVLGDPQANGAGYLDLTLPERPVAGSASAGGPSAGGPTTSPTSPATTTSMASPSASATPSAVATPTADASASAVANSSASASPRASASTSVVGAVAGAGSSSAGAGLRSPYSNPRLHP